MTWKSFCDDLRENGLRPAVPPTWASGNLRSPVSVAALIVPGAPVREPRPRDDAGKPGDDRG